MIKIDEIDYWGFEHAIRGMRNPMNSWDKSDSWWCDVKHCNECEHIDEFVCSQPDGYIIGEKDLYLMKSLYKAGSEHRKYLRQIFVSMDITAPLYWWKEFDTYKIGTVSNSCSTMHKIHTKEFTLNDFSHEHLHIDSIMLLEQYIGELNRNRENYLNHKDKNDWWQLIQLLPSSYNQKRTITMNYENVVTIINQRSGHKLDEWNDLVDVLKKLPYIKEIMNAD